MHKCCPILVFLAALVFLPACTTVPVETGAKYSKALRSSAYKLETWSFDGRLALAGPNDSWSASMNWQHRPGLDEIKLSGPLGQGAVLISLAGDSVVIDRGNGDVQSSNDVEGMVSQKLGLVVPVKLLRYWVLGVPEPDLAFNETDNGFTQLGWLNEYKQMIAVDQQMMPHKITVTKDRVKVKLVVDQWHLEGGHDQ